MDYPADIILETNKVPDYSLLYVNGKLDAKTVGNDFLIFDYNRVKPDGSWWYSPDDEFSVSFVYEGIESKRYDINLSFTNLDDVIESEAMTYANTMARESSNTMSGGTDPSFDNELGATASFDLAKAIKYFYDTFKHSAVKMFKPKDQTKWSSKKGPVFSARFDLRKGTITVIVGYEWRGTQEMLTDKNASKEFEKAVDEWKKQKPERDALKNSLHEAQEELKNAKNAQKEAEALANYNRSEERYREFISNNNEGKNDESIRNLDNFATSQYEDNKRVLDQITEQINNQKLDISNLKDQIKDLRKSVFENGNNFLKTSLKFEFGWSVTGTFKFDCNIWQFTQVTITGKVKFGVSITKHILVGYVPVYFRFGGKIEGGIKIELIKKEKVKDTNEYEYVLCKNIQDILTVFITISFRGDAGIGLYDCLSLGGFVNLEFDFQGKFDEDPDDDWKENSYGKVGFSLGIRLKVLFFELEIKFPSNKDNSWQHFFYGGPPKTTENDDEEKNNSSVNYKLAARSVYNYSKLSKNSIFGSVYQDTKPQLIDLGNEKYLLIWLNDNVRRDDLNRTELVYSIYQNGSWSEINFVTKDSGLADLNPQLYQNGESVYLTWQRFNSKINDSDSIADMSAKSEIYFAEFNNATNDFDNVTRITSNSEIDYAPKFVVSPASNETVSLIWQKNSSNDLLGLIGTNYIVGSTYKNGKWSKPETLYESDAIVSYVTGYLNSGDLYLAFVEDVDKDVMTSEDRIITVMMNGNNIYSDSDNVGNTIFVNENDKEFLYYYKNGNIVKTNFINLDIIAEGTEGEFDNGFRIVSNNNGTVIFYDTTNGQHKQSYCVVYDSVAQKWNKDITIEQCEDNSSDSIGFIAENGNVVYSYLRSDDARTYAMLDFGVKELSYKIEIESAYSVDDVVDGKPFEIDIVIKNTGDFCLNEFNVELFGQTQNVVLENPLAIDESTIITLSFIADTNNKVSEIITLTAIQNSIDVCNDEYLFYFGYVDYELNSQFVQENGEVYIILQVERLNQHFSSGTLCVYINEEEYEIVELTNICENERLQVIKIKLDDINIGDIVRVELNTDVVDRCVSNNQILTLSDKSSCSDTISDNPYANILNIAKSIV